MAILHVKTPNGTTKTVDLETMNITSSLQQNGWCKLPNGLIIQWLGIPVENIGTATGTSANNSCPISFSDVNYGILVCTSGSAVNNHTEICTARMSASAFRISQTKKSEYSYYAFVIGW